MAHFNVAFRLESYKYYIIFYIIFILYIKIIFALWFHPEPTFVVAAFYRNKITELLYNLSFQRQFSNMYNNNFSKLYLSPRSHNLVCSGKEDFIVCCLEIFCHRGED